MAKGHGQEVLGYRMCLFLLQVGPGAEIKLEDSDLEFLSQIESGAQESEWMHGSAFIRCHGQRVTMEAPLAVLKLLTSLILRSQLHHPKSKFSSALNQKVAVGSPRGQPAPRNKALRHGRQSDMMILTLLLVGIQCDIVQSKTLGS